MVAATATVAQKEREKAAGRGHLEQRASKQAMKDLRNPDAVEAAVKQVQPRLRLRWPPVPGARGENIKGIDFTHDAAVAIAGRSRDVDSVRENQAAAV